MNYKRFAKDMVKYEEEIEDERLATHLMKRIKEKTSFNRESKLMKESRSKNNLTQNTREMKIL